MKLSNIEGIMHGSVGVKLKDLVGKVLHIEFTVSEFEILGGSHDSYEPIKKSESRQEIVVVALAYIGKKLFLAERYYIEEWQESILILSRKVDEMHYNSNSFETINLTRIAVG